MLGLVNFEPGRISFCPPPIFMVIEQNRYAIVLCYNFILMPLVLTEACSCKKTNSSYTAIYGLLWNHDKLQITKGEQLLFARLCYHILATTTTQLFYSFHPGLHPRC